MQKMTKRTALILAFLLLLGLLGACSSPSASTPGSASPSPSTGGSSQPSEDPSEAPAEFVELKMVMVGPEMDSYEEIIALVNEKLKEDLNCSLTVEFLDWSDWNTKYPLMFGSGEEFDLCYTSNWAHYVNTAVKGGFLALDMADVQQYMPRIYENVTEDMWKGSIVNGEMYMIPQTGLQFTGDHNLFLVRGDLMKKYGITAIKSPDDLINYWDQIIANDPDILPIAPSNTWTAADITTAVSGGYPWLGMGWGNGVYQVFNISDPNNIVPVPDDEYWAYQEKRFSLAKDFLEKGYWSRDALSQVDDANTMFQNGISATTIGAIVHLNSIYEATAAAHPDWEVQIVDINPNLAAQYYPVTGDGMAIHATTKHKERAMQLLDLISYDREYYDLIYYGIEGTHYTLNSDGSFAWIGDPVNVGFRGMNNNLARVSNSVAPNYTEIIERFSKVAFYSPMQNFNADMTAVQTEEAAKNAVADKYDNIAHLGFIDGDIDAYIEEFRKALTDANLSKLQEEQYKQLSDYMAEYYG